MMICSIAQNTSSARKPAILASFGANTSGWCREHLAVGVGNTSGWCREHLAVGVGIDLGQFGCVVYYALRERVE